VEYRKLFDLADLAGGLNAWRHSEHILLLDQALRNLSATGAELVKYILMIASGGKRYC